MVSSTAAAKTLREIIAKPSTEPEICFIIPRPPRRARASSRGGLAGDLQVVEVQGHLDRPETMRDRAVILCESKGMARRGTVRQGEILLKKVVEVILLGVHAALAAMFFAEDVLGNTPVLLLPRLMAGALTTRLRSSGRIRREFRLRKLIDSDGAEYGDVPEVVLSRRQR